MDGISIDIADIVQRIVQDYSEGNWLEARGYAVSDNDRQIYAALVVPDYPRRQQAGIVVMARVEDNKVIIEHDTTDRPLWEELVRAGIPRDQIILTYAGEQLPQAS
jgi:hypothetical protein